MTGEYTCTCTVKCVKLVEADNPDDAVEKAEEEIQLDCDEVREIVDCECVEEE